MADIQRDLEASRSVRGELAEQLAQSRIDLERWQAIATGKDEKITALSSQLKKLKEEREDALRQIVDVEAELQVKDEILERKDVAIANLTTELEKIKAENEKVYLEEVEQLNDGVAPEESQESHQLLSNPELSTLDIQETEKRQLLTPGQLAIWINETHKLENPLNAQNVRNWFNQCSAQKQADVQTQYGFRFSHKDKKGINWFSIDKME